MERVEESERGRETDIQAITGKEGDEYESSQKKKKKKRR